MAKTRAELLKEARDLGLDVAGKTNPQMQAMITQATEGGEGHKPLGGEEPVKAKKGHTSATVLDRNGEVIRTYTEEVHGDEFVDYANEFASKEEGRKVETA